MKNIIFLKLLFLFLLLTENIQASDTASIKYFPLNVGNYFSYLLTLQDRNHPPVVSLVRSHVTKDTLINNKKYYFITNLPDNYNNCWVRTDSTTGSLYKFDAINSCPFYQYETLLDSFSIIKNDTQKNCSLPFVCTDTGLVYMFNYYTVKNRSCKYDDGGYPAGWIWYKDYAKNFGMRNYVRISGSAYMNYKLRGCRINGVIYGDTTSVIGIKNFSSEIPGSFELYQNYPNPFNPATIIKFDLRKNSIVNLTIYDALGIEVETLVNENLRAGSYEVIWSGINYPSGVYFYKLSSNENMTFIKKMVLLK